MVDVYLASYLLDVLDHDTFHVRHSAANSVDGISAGVMTPEVHSLPEHRTEVGLVFVRCGALGGSWREAREELLLGLFQEREGYPATEGLWGLKIRASTPRQGCGLFFGFIEMSNYSVYRPPGILHTQALDSNLAIHWLLHTIVAGP